MKITMEDFDIDSLLRSLIYFERYSTITYCPESICVFKSYLSQQAQYKKQEKCWTMLERKLD